MGEETLFLTEAAEQSVKIRRRPAEGELLRKSTANHGIEPVPEARYSINVVPA